MPEKNALKLFGFVFLASALAILFMLVTGYRSKVGPLVIVLFAAEQSSALALVGIVALSKLIVSIVLKGQKNWMDKALPLVSISGICLIIAIITARSRNELLTVGLTLLLAVMLHNGIGYLLGYWAARVFKLDETSCRTISIEVGMQNGGMATGLAMEVLKSTSAALAPAIFGPWMNISGSVLANWWRRKPIQNPKKKIS